MSKLRRSRDAVVRALKALRAFGFLDWIRRYEPTGNDGRGPQVQQTSNAYRLSLPERAKRLLGRFFQSPPLPADVVQRQKEHEEATAAHRASLPLWERPAEHEWENPALAAALASLGRSVAMKEQRESAKQTESPSNFIFDRKK